MDLEFFSSLVDLSESVGKITLGVVKMFFFIKAIIKFKCQHFPSFIIFILFIYSFFCCHCGIDLDHRHGSRIWSRGAQLLRPKVADIVKQSRMSKASNLWLRSRACLRALEAFGFLMLKYAFSHILETLSL